MTVHEVLTSINEYVLNEIPENTALSSIDIYEQWRIATGIHIHDAQTAMTCIETIEKLKNYNRDILRMIRK